MIVHINYEKIDRSNMLQLLTAFPQQFREARQIGEAFSLNIDHDNIKNIVFAGMGGSAIGGDLVISCLNPELKIPAFVNRNYFLPGFVDQSSLVIVSSYSGNTEESNNCYHDAKAKGAPVVFNS
jgi:glucose/mannose-6-phosphate isomerase